MRRALSRDTPRHGAAGPGGSRGLRDQRVLGEQDVGHRRSVHKGGGAITTLASGQDTPRGLVIDDTYVYFANYSNVGSVQRVAKGGGAAPTVVAANQYYPYRIAVNATTLFFTNDSTGGNVSSVSKSGGSVSVVAASQSSPRGIAIDATNVYWSTYQQVQSMLDQSYVYFTNQGDETIRRAPKRTRSAAGSPPERGAPARGVHGQHAPDQPSQRDRRQHG